MRTIQRVNVHHCAKFRVELLRYVDFFVGVASWICYVHVWTTYDEYLVVFTTVQNLFGIDTVVAIICKC